MQVNGGTPAMLTYNAADQVTNAGWSHDAAGNLTNDGTTTYTYDALNRLTQRGTTSYSYNGDGVLVYDGTTRYTQDLVAPLSQILQTTQSLATTDYLYGAERLAAVGATGRTWYLGDALSSVRMTLNDLGLPLTTHNYDPWGTPEAGVPPTTFGFTGEVQDAAAGLVYLRARWYHAGHGTFTAHRWRTDESDDEIPYSHHGYAYALSDPVLLTDPAGTCAVTDEGVDCHRAPRQPQSSGNGSTQRDFRDLTDWLYREMMHNLDDPRLQTVKELNGHSSLPTTGVRFGPFGLVCTFGLNSFLPAPVAQYLAREAFNELVADRKPWDFKHKILERLGAGITLCWTTGCQRNVEYSVPGNIHFAFVAREAGYAAWMIKLGAGNAEKDDPVHAYDPSDPRYHPYTGETHLSLGSDLNLGDDPIDNRAVSFGIQLYNKYGRSLTRAAFKQELANALPSFATSNPDPRPVRPDVASKWPYRAGYFDPTK